MASTPQLALREQFNNPEQQRDTATFGMWIFLLTEALLFGALFTAYTVYRVWYPSEFTKGSSEMEYLIGAVNTATLICSSLTMALAVESAKVGRMIRCLGMLITTMLLGVIFLGMKFTEYYLHYRDAKVPGLNFHEAGQMAGPVQMFFVFYFIMTGLHALHMMIGLGLLGTLGYRIFFGSLDGDYSTPISVAGLYWHFIDIVWVFLFAIFYIPGAHLK